jgi:hypothetical protein
MLIANLDMIHDILRDFYGIVSGPYSYHESATILLHVFLTVIIARKESFHIVKITLDGKRLNNEEPASPAKFLLICDNNVDFNQHRALDHPSIRTHVYK